MICSNIRARIEGAYQICMFDPSKIQSEVLQSLLTVVKVGLFGGDEPPRALGWLGREASSHQAGPDPLFLSCSPPTLIHAFHHGEDTAGVLPRAHSLASSQGCEPINTSSWSAPQPPGFYSTEQTTVATANPLLRSLSCSR